MKRLYYIDKLCWPVETIKGRWFLNFLRRLIHTRKVTFKRPSCLDPQPAVAIDGCTAQRGPSESDLSQKGFIPLRAFKIHDVKPFGPVTVDLQVAMAADLQKSHAESLEAGAPYDLSQKEPNASTRETIEKAERGEDVKTSDTVEEMFEDLSNGS